MSRLRTRKEIEFIELNGIPFKVKIHYEYRNSWTVSVGNGTVNIRIPVLLNRKESVKKVQELKAWAKKKILEDPRRFRLDTQKEYKNGDILKVGSEKYFLEIELKDKKSSSARIIDNTIKISVSSNLTKEKQNDHISTLISRCIGGKRLPELWEKIDLLNKRHFGQKVNNIYFKNLKSRWGSCSGKGNINISTRLLFAPEDVLEYVCIHELAHLIMPNHSKKFWALVQKAMPGYKDKIKWLKNNGKSCKF